MNKEYRLKEYRDNKGGDKFSIFISNAEYTEEFISEDLYNILSQQQPTSKEVEEAIEMMEEIGVTTYADMSANWYPAINIIKQALTVSDDSLKSFCKLKGEGERMTLLIEGTSTKIPCKIWNTEIGFNELVVAEVFGEMTEEEAKYQESGGFEIFIEIESFKKVYKKICNIELTDSIIYSSEGAVFDE